MYLKCLIESVLESGPLAEPVKTLNCINEQHKNKFKKGEVMKTFRLCSAVLLLFCCVFICGTAFSAGNGSGGGSGSGSGSDLGDLVVLLRDASGVPILSSIVGSVGCEQPIDVYGAIIPLVPDDTCAVEVGKEGLLQSVDFGRTNVIRAPSQTVDQQLADLLVSLGTAQCITLDPAGRLMLTSPDALDSDGDGDTTEFISKAVDSPLQNLAIYREMMLKGELGNPAIKLPSFDGYGFLDTAAKALGAAIDKEGKIGVDQIVYLNQILGLSDIAADDNKICIMVKEEVQGKMVLIEKCFLKYDNYSYTRSQTHGNLPYPAYITDNAGNNNGTFEYLSVYPSASGPNEKPLFWIASGQIESVVFGGIQSGSATTNIGAFAQAADDSRGVINFMHSHPVMAGYETPIPCGVSPISSYDVALSGLQVPVSMAVGTTREGTVTVTNEGPDPATGTVTIKGILANGDMLVSETFPFNNLSRGTSKSETFVFTGPASATTIAWTATVTAAQDVQNNNNSLTETTDVTATNKTPSSGKAKKK